ncbi:MAG: hypothetical protein ACYDBP_15095 [Leptospirales bacterium]
METEETALANDLIALSGVSMSQIARDAEIVPANLSIWLRGSKSAIGGEAKSRLFHRLGIAGGTLSPLSLHFWSLRSDELSAFHRVMNWIGKPVEIIHVAPEQMRVKDWLPNNYSLPLAAYNEHLRIFLRRRVSPLAASVDAPDPEKLPAGSRWKDIPPDRYFNYPVLRIPTALFDRALSKDLSSQEFDALFQGGAQPPSPRTNWDEVIQSLQERGFDAASALKWIRSSKDLPAKE